MMFSATGATGPRLRLRLGKFDVVTVNSVREVHWAEHVETRE
jgi:hypothetical protein